MFEGQEDEGMAPSRLGWHEQYVRTMHRCFDDLFALTQDPAFQDAEDLGDFAEAITTLLTFRPRTRDDIEQSVADDFRAIQEDPYGHCISTIKRLLVAGMAAQGGMNDGEYENLKQIEEVVRRLDNS